MKTGLSGLMGGLLLACAVVAGPAEAMVFFKRSGVMIIHSAYASGDEARLREVLTPEVRTVILRGPSGGGWNRGRELAGIIEKAGVKTVVHGVCAGLVCPMMFMAGKERLFSGETRPEATYVRLAIATGEFPDTAGEDRGESWSNLMDWWRNHSKLSYAQTRPQHQPLLQTTSPATESKMIFHPAARTSKGSVMHCWGDRQTVPYCEAVAETDALQLGIITSAELFRDSDVLKERPDMARPKAVEGRISDAPGSQVSDGCNRLYAEFLRFDSPRAFAIGSGGGCSYRTAQSLRPYAEALAACTKINHGRECRLYAVDDDLVFVDFKQPLSLDEAAK